MKPIHFLPLILLLAGCAEPPGTHPSEDEDPPEALEWQRFKGNYTFILDKTVPGAQMGSDLGTKDNCVSIHFGEFGRDGAEIRDGMAALTWIPRDPLANTLHLIVFRPEDGHQDEYNGPSPLEASFSSEGEKLKYGFVFSVENGLHEVPRQQEARIYLQLEYLSEHAPIVHPEASCDLML